MRATKIVKLVTLAGCCTIALAGCGSSAKPTTLVKSASTGISAAVRFSNCMRSHGVSDFPDLSAGGGPMGQQLARSGVNLNAPAFQSAMNACKALAPAAKAAVGPTFGQSKAMMVAFARCMRAHGLIQSPAFDRDSAACGMGTPSGQKQKPPAQS